MRALPVVLVGGVLRIEPDAHGIFFVLDGDKFGVPLGGQRTQTCDQVELIFAGGEEGVDDLHGNFDLDARFLAGMVLIEDMDKEIAVLFGHADVGVVALDGDEFAVFGEADGVEQGAQIYTVAVELVDPDPTAMKALPIEGGQNLFGELEGNVDADGLLFGVLVVHTNVEPTVLLGRRMGGLGGIYRVLGRFGRVALSDAGDWRECECGSNDGCDSWKPSGAIEHGGRSPSRDLG